MFPKVKIFPLLGLCLVCTTPLLAGCREPAAAPAFERPTPLAFATRNSPTTFYYGVEGIEGPEYELMRGFADYLGKPVALIVAPSAGEAINEVVRKRATIAAAGVVATTDRQERLAFGPTYRTISQHLVYRRDRPAPQGPRDLLGREVQVVAGSSHARRLAELQIDYPELRFVEVPDVDQLDLLARVSSGAIDFTVADSSEFSVGRHLHPDLSRAFELSGGLPIAWALPADHPELLEQVNAYFSLISQNGELDRILSRYEAHEKNFDYLDSRDFLRLVQERLPGLRPHFEEAAALHGVDWRLLAAIGYQESLYDPLATSVTGVRGLMMLTEDTARRVGVQDRLDARSSILGGARYLVETRDRLPERITEPDRTLMALAAYNVGFGHLEDARVLTQRFGRDPDRWDDVRVYLPLLTQERWYSQTRYGYARGWEPVGFVANVVNYRDRLVWMTGEPDAELRLDLPGEFPAD